MTTYELLLFLHVTAATIWLGAGFLISVLIFGAERAGDRAKEAGHHQDVGWLSTRLFVPASLSTMIFGLLVVAEGSWSFEQLWITLGFLAWLASFLMGFFFFRPEAGRIGALAAEHGPAYPEVEWRIRRLNLADRFQLTILFLAVGDMVIKPTGDDAGVLIAGAAILAGVAALAMASLRKAPRAAPAAAPGSPPPAA